MSLNDLRIAYILTSLGLGGAERNTIALAHLMVARGHSVCIVVLRERLAEQWQTHLHVQHLDIRKNPFAVVRGYLQAIRILRAFNPDILHTHNVHGNVLGRLLKPALARVSVISTIHNVYEGGWLRTQAYRFTDRLSFATVAVSRAAAERAIQARAVPRRKSLTILNGIDISEFKPDAERRSAMRTSLGLDGSFVWMTAGRLAPAKDYPNLLYAFALVHAAEPEARLLIAGHGPHGHADRLRAMAKKLGLENVVNWLGARKDIPALLDAADGFVLASAWEGMPLALAEAMTMRKPVVATDVGGVRELVDRCGVLVKPRDSSALGIAMLHMMRLPEEVRRSLGAESRFRTSTQFSIESRAKEWEALYRVAINWKERPGVPRP